MSEKKDIRKETSEGLENFFEKHGERSFRTRQISEWLWKRSAGSFEEMTNLSLKVRDLLEKEYSINRIRLETKQVSTDGTIKMAFRLHDDNVIESVLIPKDDRMTACISSQVGCSLSCKFCATGYMDRVRNLDPGEIYDQVVEVKKISEAHYDRPLTNIVYMGMGEPLLNYSNVLRSTELITSPNGLGMSGQRLTLSTAGIAKMIRRLADDNVRFKLALSLHAANDKKRDQIMPINETNTLDALAGALDYFYSKTRSRITLEYILFKKFNDSLDDARELHKFSKRFPCKVNIIEYNPISEADYVNTDSQTMTRFRSLLDNQGVNVRLRKSRGKDIDAACGQLANKH